MSGADWTESGPEPGTRACRPYTLPRRRMPALPPHAVSRPHTLFRTTTCMPSHRWPHVAALLCRLPSSALPPAHHRPHVAATIAASPMHRLPSAHRTIRRSKYGLRRPIFPIHSTLGPKIGRKSARKCCELQIPARAARILRTSGAHAYGRTPPAVPRAQHARAFATHVAERPSRTRIRPRNHACNAAARAIATARTRIRQGTTTTLRNRTHPRIRPHPPAHPAAPPSA